MRLLNALLLDSTLYRSGHIDTYKQKNSRHFPLKTATEIP